MGLPLEKYKGVFIPTLLDIENVQSIITSETNTYFVNKDGDIYSSVQHDDISQNKLHQYIPLKVLNFKNIQGFISSNYKLNSFKYGLIYCENSIYELKFDKIEKTVFQTFEEYFYDKFDNKRKSLLKTGITYKTVHIHHGDIRIDSFPCKIKTEKYHPRYLRYTNNIDKFEISVDISEDVRNIIKYFHVFKYFAQNILFVTIDDKVFGLGDNYCGVCGLGHQNKIRTLELIPELCDKGVIKFFNGRNFVLCLTSDNKLYSWGKNNHGQLGIGQLNKYKIFKPQLIEYFNNKTIVQVCCGQRNSSVLTSDNCVHLWGYYNNENDIESQIECELKEEIKSIYSSESTTFCITNCGKVYYWKEYNRKFQLISIESLQNIESISSKKSYTYFISFDSKIYSMNNNNERLLTEINTIFIIENPKFGANFQSISNPFSECVLFNDHSGYEFKGNECWKTKYKNPFDYYCDKYEVTFETIELKVMENIRNEVSKTTNYFIKNFVSQENDLSYILKTFPISNKIGVLRSFIKYFYLFFDTLGHNILFITNDDYVYGFGNNNNGLCGLGHNKSVSEPQIIRELCYKNVIKFFNCYTFAMALTNDYQLYAWGNGTSEDFGSFSKPTKIFDSEECKIENIYCSTYHALILNVEGKIYGWGDNSEGQIDCGKEIFITTPLKIEKLPKIKIIACNNVYSIAVSEANLIIVWGKDICENIVIEFEHDILNICMDKFSKSQYSYILTKNGEILYCDIISKGIFKKSYYLVLVVIENCVYFLNTKQELVRTQYKTVYDYCAEELQITYKTIDLKLQNEIQTKELNIKGKNIKRNDILIIKFETDNSLFNSIAGTKKSKYLGKYNR